MCLDCQQLYAQVADLHTQLTAHTQSWTAGEEGGATELAQLRTACAHARQELQEHRKQHKADESPSSRDASPFREPKEAGAR